METKQLIHVPPAFSGKCGASSGGRRQGRSAFTPAQLHELHQQSLVFSYIVAGLSVPFPLILPIWRSVARSSDYANGEIYNQYPSFIGFGPQGYDYRITMDPEPGRCRRTDGKKWRCSKEVVSDQKYCERHMHRGCRSRKRVKAYISTPESATATTALNHNNTATVKSSASTNTESNQSISVPVNLQLATPSSNSGGNTYAAKAPTTIPTADISGINEQDNKVDAKKDATSTATTVILTAYGSNKESNKSICGKDATDTTTCLTGAATDNKSNSRNDNDCVNEEDAICNHLDKRVNIERSINKGNNVNAGSLVASGFGFSPKSVLQAVGSSSSCLDYRNFIETEMQRCRRTDGKKWRCSNEVIPDQKYCGRHLHRGAKKLVVAAQSVTVAAAPPLPPSSLYLAPPLAIPKKTYGHKNLDTNLSISIASSSQHMTCDEKSSTSNSSSSDATTITDENGSISHLLALSP